MDIEPGISNDYLPMDPKRLLERLHTALNARDLTNLVHLLQVDFEQIWPAQPDRNTIGLEAMRETWERIFRDYPDFRADLVRQSIESNVIWSEWHWEGSEQRGQGQQLDQVGVVVFGVEQDLIAWGRFYLIDVSGAKAGAA